MINTNYQPGDSIIKQQLQRLSTGIKINSASEDAAGLAIAGKMKSQIEGAAQARMNIGQGIDMLNTAEGGMSNISESLQKMRELAVQSANGTLNVQDRMSLNTEYQSLKEQIGVVSQSTQYNQKSLLNGKGGELSLQTGPDSGDQIKIGTADASTDSLGLSNGDISTQNNAQSAIASLDNAIEKISTQRTETGASQNRLEEAGNVMDDTENNTASSLSGIMDTDYGAETAALNKNKVLMQAAIYAENLQNREKGKILDLLT